MLFKRGPKDLTVYVAPVVLVVVVSLIGALLAHCH